MESLYCVFPHMLKASHNARFRVYFICLRLFNIFVHACLRLLAFTVDFSIIIVAHLHDKDVPETNMLHSVTRIPMNTIHCSTAHYTPCSNAIF